MKYPNMRPYLDPYAAADVNESDSEDEDAAEFA